jgi:hypothetical protein
LLANSNISVEDFAISIYFTADSIVVEDVAGGAFGTETVDPGLTAEIVVDSSHELGVVIFRP